MRSAISFRRWAVLVAWPVLVLTAAPASTRRDVPWLDPIREETKGTEYRTFFSRTINQPASYQICFPPGYAENPERRYPVIYWLHGLGGDQHRGTPFTEKLTAAIKAGSASAMIVVLVNGLRDRFYCDAADGTVPLESVIVRDLIAEVDQVHRTLARREARVIEGA